MAAPRDLGAIICLVARQCIFCGGKPLTSEHVFGAWLTPLFPVPAGKRVFLDAATVTKGQPTTRPRRYPRNIDLKVKQVCKSCNCGWMSDLETDAARVVADVHDGRSLLINSDQQGILASWAAKTAVTTQYLGNCPEVPMRVRQWLYTNHTPPPNTSVWVARYDGPGITTSVSRQLVIGEGQGTSLTPDMQAVSFSIGSLFFIVLSMYSLESVPFRN